MAELTGQHGTSEGRSSTPLVSVIIATLDESGSVAPTIRAVFEYVRPPVEVIIVDDNSKDGTRAVIEGLNDPRIRLVHRERGKGLASAITRGIMESKGAVVAWIDADMAAESRLLAPLIAATETHDLAIASRFVMGGGDERHPFRVMCSRLVNGFATLVLGYGIRDYDSCVAAVRRSVFDAVLPVAYGYGDFFIEFVYGCCRKGFRVIEVPYTLLDRQEGNSKSFPSLGPFLWLGVHYCVRVVATRFRRD